MEESNISLISIIALIISVINLIIYVLMFLIRRKEPWAQSLINLVDRIENEELRRIRREVIYKLSRDDWSVNDMEKEEVEKKIDRWGAEMDILALLYFSGQINKEGFFQLYGDVLIRTIYQLAPYANEQRRKRGKQFWLLFSRLGVEIKKEWERQVKKKKYPSAIRSPHMNDTISIKGFQSDGEVQDFLEG